MQEISATLVYCSFWSACQSVAWMSLRLSHFTLICILCSTKRLLVSQPPNSLNRPLNRPKVIQISICYLGQEKPQMRAEVVQYSEVADIFFNANENLFLKRLNIFRLD